MLPCRTYVQHVRQTQAYTPNKFWSVTLHVNVTLFTRQRFHRETFSRCCGCLTSSDINETPAVPWNSSWRYWTNGVFDVTSVHAGDSGRLRFRPIHEGFYPRCTVDEFCGGYNILHTAVFHLWEETQSGYFCIGHATQKKHQGRSILPLLACKTAGQEARQRNASTWSTTQRKSENWISRQPPPRFESSIITF